ncbi:MAG: cardiolipin synthase ClsB [Alcaligenaceae bacterium]|nr:MAG: cardiolipin synthase ClsB [Alcaligenaceae bacterium]
MKVHWTEGNAFTLLENGEDFFPAVNEAIDAAHSEVLLETFILFDDKVGQALRDALVRAATRGVRVDMLVDGYGSAELGEAFISSLTSVGVGFHVFDPGTRVFGMRTNLVRRMHRKTVVVDGNVAFVGGNAKAAFVTRDNVNHPTLIEQHYRVAIRTAQREIVIANAYFFPGYRFLRDLRRAAKRGVKVRLILQGEPDMPVAKLAASMLYDYLLSAGVEIYEYCARPLHGKVAIADEEWSTVGSSNLDPLSLALNLEANVMIRDARFTAFLRERLQVLIDQHCTQIKPNERPRRKIYRTFIGVLVFHFLRRFPAWASSLPRHKAQLKSIKPAALPSTDEGEAHAGKTV